MSHSSENSGSSTLSPKQVFFLKYLTFTLVDLTVLNFVAEYWDKVTIASFTVSLFIAITLQILLKMFMALEERIADLMKSNDALNKKAIRILTAWLILLVGKFVILWILQVIFGDAIVFAGAYHGVITFILVVVAILVCELILTRIFRSLA